MVSLVDILLPDQGDYIIRTKDVKLNPNLRGVGEELYKALHRHKDKVAQIKADTGDSHTFAELLTRSVRVAVNLRRMGVTPDDILTPCTNYHLDATVTFLAIIFSGAKVSSIDPLYADDQGTKQLALIRPKMMFCSTNSLQRAVAIVEKLKLDTKIVVFGQTHEYMSFDELLVPHVEEEISFVPYVPKDSFETFAIIFSSGSTGSPNGICLHNYGILDTNFPTPSDMKQQSSVFMAYLSLAWSSNVSLLCAHIILGNTILICQNFEAKIALQYIEKYKVTSVFLLPFEILPVINAKPPDLKLPYLKSIVTGGVASSAEAMIRTRNAFPGTAVLTVYGQTETGIATIFSEPDMENSKRKPGSCGRPLHGCHIKVCDPETGNPLGPNNTGEFRIKSKRNMVGYYNQDSSGRYDQDGYLKTGDLLYYDEDYYFYFIERLNHVLRYKFYNIIPVEIEGILQEHPGVDFAVVLGITSEDGDLPVGVIVRNNRDVTQKDLENFVAERTEPWKKLYGGVVFVEKSYIPFTATGKVRQRLLKTKILEDHKLPLR